MGWFPEILTGKKKKKSRKKCVAYSTMYLRDEDINTIYIFTFLRETKIFKQLSIRGAREKCEGDRERS